MTERELEMTPEEMDDLEEMAAAETEMEDGGVSDEEAAYWEEQRRQEMERKVAPCRELGQMIRRLSALTE